MAYKINDILEITHERSSIGGHEFKKGEKVRVTAVHGAGEKHEHYKCDSTHDGRKTSWYVDRRDLIKRRQK